jgi:hypothetical protein
MGRTRIANRAFELKITTQNKTSRKEEIVGKKLKRKGCGKIDKKEHFTSINLYKMEIMLEEED